MSTFQPAPSPFAPQGTAFAATPTSGCRCHAAVAEGHAALAVPMRATSLAADDALAAVGAAKGLDWQGGAADLFRHRLAALASPLGALDADVTATLRMAEAGGAS